MKYKVCIPTAGIGSRLGHLKKNLNKSLVNVGGKPVISHIIEKFGTNAEFVIPIGFGGEAVTEFINLAYPKLNVIFIKIDKFQGEGSGLGYTLSKSKKFLQSPFYFISCDTLIKNSIPEYNYNWVGFSKKDNSKEYRTLNLDNQRVVGINEKNIYSQSNKAYIGLAFIKDYKIFWGNLEDKNSKFITQGEVCGLKNLISKNLLSVEFDWYDTGTPNELKRSKKAFKKNDSINILEKENEDIWFVNDIIIKYSSDQDFISNRVKRANILENYVPKILSKSSNMYSYKKVKGEVLSKVLNTKNFEKLLSFSKKFWLKKNLNNNEKKVFKNLCFNFYNLKTLKRINDLFLKYPLLKEVKEINSKQVKSIELILNEIDWETICDGDIGRFHGDFHFENIILNESNNNFTFIDWRQDFSGNLIFGDIYYDLAKLMHGLIIEHEIIAKNNFSAVFNKHKLKFNFKRNYIHIQCEEIFKEWLKNNSYDVKKVYTLTALIFLNIAPLHHHPYDFLLYGLGHNMLEKELST